MSNKPWVQVDGNESEQTSNLSLSHHRVLPNLIIASRDIVIEILQSNPNLKATRLAKAILRGAWTKGPRVISTELSLAYEADVPPMVIANAIADCYQHPYQPRHSFPSNSTLTFISSNYQPRHLQPQ